MYTNQQVAAYKDVNSYVLNKAKKGPVRIY